MFQKNANLLVIEFIFSLSLDYFAPRFLTQVLRAADETKRRP
jgi:hypothetical protein